MRAARRAGYHPEIIPTALDTKIAMNTYGNVTFSVAPNATDKSMAVPAPIVSPSRPPVSESITDSLRN